MEVPVSKLQIISVKTLGHVLGNRPSVPIGGCSLNKWEANNIQLLTESLTQNPRGAMIEYTLDQEGDYDAIEDTITIHGVTSEEPGAVLPVKLYRGYIKDKVRDPKLIAGRLKGARDIYLRSKALQLVHEAAEPPAPMASNGLKPPMDDIQRTSSNL